MKRIYISGPMSGMPEHNFPAFNAEAARLRALGYDVVNPAELNPEPEKTWHDCLRTDLMELLTCDAIALLAGWQKSAGATWRYTSPTASVSTSWRPRTSTRAQRSPPRRSHTRRKAVFINQP